MLHWKVLIVYARLFEQKKNYNLALIQDNASLLFNCYSMIMEECNIGVFFFILFFVFNNERQN